MDENGFPKLACVMVGLPARGKTFIARKVARYLNWLGHQTRIINVGDYRRTELGVFLKSDCFDPNNQEYAAKRSQLADRALADMIAWFNSGDKSRFNIDSEDAELNSPCAKSAAGVGGPSSIALYDATNSTKSRREKIANSCNEHGIKVMFIESICDDPARILQNIREVKVNCPDYQNFEKEEAAINDFQARIQQYEKCYESISETELQGRICFVKLLKLGTQIKINNLQGYLQSRIVYFLMNLNIHPRSFYISRHGESMFNTLQKIGGNSPLSERGLLFASKLPEQIAKIVDPGMNLVVWTSTLKRSIQTGETLPYQQLQWKQLDELSTGDCDGLTYEEIEKLYPLDYLQRDHDKFNFRYHGGESYRDLVQRLEPVILELERHNTPDQLIYIIGHQAVVRCIYAYFRDIRHDELPYIKIPLHTVLKLSPRAYECHEERFVVDVPAVDTFRAKVSPAAVRARLKSLKPEVRK